MEMLEIAKEKLGQAGYTLENGFTVEDRNCESPVIRTQLTEKGIEDISDIVVQNPNDPDILMLVETADIGEAPNQKATRLVNIYNKLGHTVSIIAIFVIRTATEVQTHIAIYHIKRARIKPEDYKCSVSEISRYNTYRNIIHKIDEDERKSIMSYVGNSIWAIADDTLRGSFKETEYEDIIIPMTSLIRLDEELKSTKDTVIDTYNKIVNLQIPKSDMDAALMRVSGHYYYNTSGYDLNDVARYDNSEVFIDYLNGYSDNVINIMQQMNFYNTVLRLGNVGKIYNIVSKFIEIQSNIGELRQDEMGLVYEDLVRRFSGKNKDGEHFTSPDIVRLCCALMIDSDEDKIKNTSRQYTIYDQAMGTSQMLTTMAKFVKELNYKSECRIYGQELNPKTWGMAVAGELIKTHYDENTPFESHLKLGNTLTNDKLRGYTFDYCISNPPFGKSIKNEIDVIREDSKYSSIGIPASSDGQMLFDINGVSHLNETGRMAIIHNGSPLFSGAGGSGEAAIREYLISNDLIEAIVKLTDSLFYNTKISTYIWVMTKAKKDNRKGKIQLIDASQIFKKLRKSEGDRSNEIPEDCRDLIFNTLNKFEDAEYTLEGTDKVCKSKIFDNSFFKGEPDAQGRYKWEIPFDKIFYVAEEKQDSEAIKQRIIKLNAKIQAGMTELFGD